MSENDTKEKTPGSSEESPIYIKIVGIDMQKSIENRLDLIVSLLVLLVNQMELKGTHQNSVRFELEADKESFEHFGKVFRPYNELLENVASLFEVIRQGSKEPKMQQRIS